LRQAGTAGTGGCRAVHLFGLRASAIDVTADDVLKSSYLRHFAPMLSEDD
jgi:hypothetical protein